MDLTHCGWSDIFFLGMDFPEGRQGAQRLHRPGRTRARRRAAPAGRSLSARHRGAAAPPGERRFGRHGGHHQLAEVFDFAKDYLGLLKAAVIASGWCRPGSKDRAEPADCWRASSDRGCGLEIVSNVNNIPKGSRLAVSTDAAGRAGQRLHARHRAGGIAHRASCRSTSAGWCWRGRCSANGSAAPAAAGRIPAASGRA